MPICYPEHKSKNHDDKKALKLIFESLFLYKENPAIVAGFKGG